MPTAQPITEHCLRSAEHTQFYLACGPEDGPLVIFVHGWPELSWSWRHQLPVLGALGFRAIAPDMRGYGRSTLYPRIEDYAQEHVVGDMIRLLDHLTDGRADRRAVWVGHDWGSPTAWNIARHHPDRCRAVASLCVPYDTIERGLDTLIALSDRTLYPEAEFPAAQWDYMRYYEESFPAAVASMDAHVGNAVRLLFRKGSADSLGKPAGTAYTRRMGGWFAGASEPPAMPRDEDVLSEEDCARYTAALTGSGFFGPDAYYMNHARNAAWTASAPNDGTLAMPVLFLHARYDTVCETMSSRMAEPMRAACRDLQEAVVDSGHWMAQERPRDVNAELVRWLATRVPGSWPRT
jgi:pimeloyl-ACP methyl ester carboxylesterase